MSKQSVSIRRFIQAVRFNIDCGYEFLWDCYGQNAAGVGWTKEDNSASAGIVYDTKTHVVYELSVWDTENELVLLWTREGFRKARLKEYKSRNLNPRIAYDKVRFVEATPKRCLSLLEKLIRRKKRVQRSKF
jgi:hypothetical protein